MKFSWVSPVLCRNELLRHELTSVPCFVSQEQEIRSLSAEIESLKKPQTLGPSQEMDELRDENTKLKYRVNILKKVSDATSDAAGEAAGEAAGGAPEKQQMISLFLRLLVQLFKKRRWGPEYIRSSKPLKQIGLFNLFLVQTSVA